MNDSQQSRKEILYDIVFKSDTKLGKAFDIILIIAILSNSLLVISESVDWIRKDYGLWIGILNWSFICFFTLEYFLRIWIAPRKRDYISSFFGVIDFLAVFPFFLTVFFPNLGFLMIIRIFRLLRIFSILKMARYIKESNRLLAALRASKAKIIVFIFTILFIVTLVGSIMYIVEGPENGYKNIPLSMYWAIVTVSTVGYGDISPQTPLGKFISSLLMIVAYGIIAVPTGIISHEFAKNQKDGNETQTCLNCNALAHSKEDKFCSSCGTSLSIKK